MPAPHPNAAARGDLSNAFKCYVRTRDYCQTSKHSIDMCLNIIRASIALGNYVHVQSYVQKAEASPDASADPAVVAKLRVAAGLSHLDARKFKMAARKFCETPFEVGSDFNDVVSPQARRPPPTPHAPSRSLPRFSAGDSTLTSHTYQTNKSPRQSGRGDVRRPLRPRHLHPPGAPLESARQRRLQLLPRAHP